MDKVSSIFQGTRRRSSASTEYRGRRSTISPICRPGRTCAAWLHDQGAMVLGAGPSQLKEELRLDHFEGRSGMAFIVMRL